MGKAIWWVEKSILIIATFAAILFFYTLFKVWSEGKLNYFLFIGDYESAAIVFLVIMFIGMMLKWFWKWEVRTALRPGQRGRR